MRVTVPTPRDCRGKQLNKILDRLQSDRMFQVSY